MNNRMPQVNELVKQYLSILILQHIPGKIISVTEVSVSKDLSYAKVWVSATEDVDAVVAQCQSNAALFQRELAGKLTLRRVPKLHFVADKSGESVDKIEGLLKKIKDNEKK